MGRWSSINAYELLLAETDHEAVSLELCPARAAVAELLTLCNEPTKRVRELLDLHAGSLAFRSRFGHTATVYPQGAVTPNPLFPACLTRLPPGREACEYGCAIGFAASYAVLVLVQAALVLALGRPRRLVSSRGLGLTIPAAALVAGVAVAQIGGGADFLTALAAVATPLLAAGAGWARGWRLPWLPALCVAPLYAVAWLRPDAWASDLAGVALIAGACLAITGLVAGVAPRSWLTVGLVLLVVLDVIFVWGDRQVEPTMNALQSAAPPTIGRPLPELQQVDFGSATMGWLDFAAPALLGLLVLRQAAAAVATGLAAGLWGLLLLATSPIAATPPVLVGLIAGRSLRGRLPILLRPFVGSPYG